MVGRCNKIKILFTFICCTLLAFVMTTINSAPAYAVSNEIGTFKETVFVNVLRDSNNQNNIIDSQSGNWGRITANYKYGLRINLRRTGGNNNYPFETGDIIDLSYVLVNSSYITAGGNAPSQPTCLNSSWIFTVVDCTIHMQNVSDIEYLTTMYNVDLTMLRNPTDDSSAIAGLIRQWSAGQPESYSNNINIYYFQYRLRYTGAGESRDNIILYGNFTNGQPWWLQFNETIPISSSLSNESAQIMNEQKQENEQQGTQSNTDSTQAGQSVEQGTQSILSVITGFFGAFINAQASNCNFDTGQILGTIDMCSTNIPTQYNVILSIVSLLFVVPMALWLLNSIINAFKEFQQ